MVSDNRTLVTEFIILGFPSVREVELLLFPTFLLMYALTLTENVAIILVVGTDCHLCTPMYFFISNLSFLDIGYTTVTVPKMLADIAIQSQTISVSGRFTHFFLGSAELAWPMTVTWPLAIHCITPPLWIAELVYGVLWGVGWVASLHLPFPLPSSSSCLSVAPTSFNHFCDSAPLLELSCQNIFEIKVINFVVGTILLMNSLLLTMFSYIFIVATILHILTAEGCSKAFSTCASHLTTVTIFYGTSIFTYICTKTIQTFDFNKTVSAFYSVVTPVLNPVIYILRNNDIEQGMRKVLLKQKDTPFV